MSSQSYRSAGVALACLMAAAASAAIAAAAAPGAPAGPAAPAAPGAAPGVPGGGRAGGQPPVPQIATFPKPGEALVLTRKPRTIVTTDIETDDYDSVIRYLLYTNDFDTVGLIYGSSQYHWAGDGKGTLFTPRGTVARASLRWTGTEHIQDLIEQYRKAYPNLRVHDRSYPTPDYLLSLIKMGNIEVEGDVSKETEGSNWIKDKLLDNVPGPLFLQAWGGTNTVARALMSIEAQYKDTPQWPAIHAKISKKAVLYSFAKQDNTYDTYIARVWPDIRFDNIAGNAWGYWNPTSTNVLDKDRFYMQGAWTRANILNVGPIGAKYRVWGDGRFFEGDTADNFGLTPPGNRAPMEKDHFISEGDTPAFLNLINNGLRGYEHPSYGGWGNRLAKPADTAAKLNYWVGAQGEKDENGAVIPTYTSKRWVSYAQNDFAARLKWSVTPTFAGANHQPVVRVAGGLNRTARPGATVTLNGSATDPDRGNVLTYKWWQYQEAGSYPGAVTFSSTNTGRSSFVVPADAKSGQTIHALLEVMDNGAPRLTRWERVIVTVI